MSDTEKKRDGPGPLEADAPNSKDGPGPLEADAPNSLPRKTSGNDPAATESGEHDQGSTEEVLSELSKATSDKSSDDDDDEGYFYTVDDAVNKGGFYNFQKVVTFLGGLGWMAEAFEVIILSVIGDFLACDWEIRRWQNALMTSIVFLGMTFGAPVLGWVADRYGRRTTLAISFLLLFIFRGACAVANNFPMMCVLRFLMGSSLGGAAQGITICCEYYPANVRGRAGFYLGYYWCFGGIALVTCAWLIMTYLNSWRVFLGVAAVPALIVFLLMKWYPESARYYLVSNQPDEAEKTLRRLVRINKTQLPRGHLITMDVTEERGRMLDLFKPKTRRTTLQFWYIWFAVACAYYGIVLITPNIIQHGSLQATSERVNSTSIKDDFLEIIPCGNYSNSDYGELMWTTAAEIPGLIFFSVAIEYSSRNVFLGTACITLAVMMLFLMVEIRPQIGMLIVLSVCRAIAAGVFHLCFIMTTESFPTTLRGTALGTGSGIARFGGMVVPCLAQILIPKRPVPGIFCLSAIVALAGISGFLLPVDTRARFMTDAVSQEKIDKKYREACRRNRNAS